MSDKDKTRPRGRPKASGIRKLSKSVTVKFSRIDYERLLHRSRQANRTLAEFIREAAFEARIVARHSTEEAAVIRNLVGMANNLNSLPGCPTRQGSTGQGMPSWNCSKN